MRPGPVDLPSAARFGGRRRVALVCAMSFAVLGLGVPGAHAATASAVDLGTLSGPSVHAALWSVLPGVPATPTAVAGPGAVTVSWLAPVSSGIGPVIGYTVVANPGGATCSTTGGLTCTVSGLTNGTTYTFTVTAANELGVSASSVATAAAVPVAPPGAATSVVAVAGAGSVTATWAAPDNGGTPITIYTAVTSPGGLGCTTTGALSCTVTGLVNGTAYTVVVIAGNAVGTGPASAPAAAVIPAVVPEAPGSVRAVRGDRRATVSWVPASNGGRPITAYTVVASPGGASCTTTGGSCTVTGLVNGKPYTFTVTASNALGAGPASAATARVVPATSPGAPVRVSVMRGQLSAVVTWAAPPNGGSAITSYRAVASPGGRSCTSRLARRCTVTGLVNGRSYRFTVTAANAVGASRPSLSSADVVPAQVPGVPTRVRAVRGNRGVTVLWTAPPANGTPGTTGYRVVASPGGASCTTKTLRCAVTGLVNGRAYTFSVAAINRVGAGPASEGATARPATTPSPVRGLAAAFPVANRTALSWVVPVSNGGLSIGRYELRTSADNGRTWSRWTSVAMSQSAATTGWRKGRLYLAEVRAVNAVGGSVPARIAVRPTR